MVHINHPHAKDFSVDVVLTLCFLSCSIATCGAVLIHFLVKKNGLAETASRLLFCLALSDFIGATVWFVDTLIPDVLCPWIASANMFGYQSAEIWTCIIGAYLIITCSAKQPPPEIIFYLVAWGLPIISQVVILSLNLIHEYPPPQGCWVDYGHTLMFAVTIPQLICVVLNAMFLGTIIYKMRISAKRWGLRSRDKGLFFVQICFMLTTIGSILESVPNARHEVYAVAVCFGALQGFFNSLAMKQKALLQFMVTVKTKIRPARKKNTTADTTWLLDKNKKRHPHPADTESYADFYSTTSADSDSTTPQSSMTFLASTPNTHSTVSTIQ
jgi:hypothetical protein